MICILLQIIVKYNVVDCNSGRNQMSIGRIGEIRHDKN